MNTEKYYTPSIEEFHVGFEYESFDPELGWCECLFYELTYDIFDEKGKNPFEYYYPHPDKIRVKYLDQEDIESFGWELDKGLMPVKVGNSGSFTGLGFTKDEIKIIYFPDTHSISIISIKGEIFYRGTCKNKNRLKQLLTDTGILTDSVV